MLQYISLIRGINVSGHNIIKMQDLVELYKRIGFVNVQTYIQSGNLIFYSSFNDLEKMQSAIISKIENVFGITVDVFIYTKNELQFLVENNPFLNEENYNSKNLYITFLSECPDNLNIRTIRNADISNDKFVIQNNFIYLYCPKGYGKTKLSNSFFEKKLKVSATTRNWNTLNKLIDLCN